MCSPRLGKRYTEGDTKLVEQKKEKGDRSILLETKTAKIAEQAHREGRRGAAFSEPTSVAAAPHAGRSALEIAIFNI